MCCGQDILDGVREELEDVDNTVFGSDSGLANIRVPVFHSAIDDLGFFCCIHHSVASVVVDGRYYDVAIAATEVPRLVYVGIVVYENMAPSRSNWGGIIFERAIEVLPF